MSRINGPPLHIEVRLQRGIRLFNNREFFECHEILEEEWTHERGPRRLFLQALIHIAVAFVHEQRGNPVGACGQLGKGLSKLAAYLPAYEGVDTARLYQDAQAALMVIEAGAVINVYPLMRNV